MMGSLSGHDAELRGEIQRFSNTPATFQRLALRIAQIIPRWAILLAMGEVPKSAPNDFVKSLFWLIVLIGLFAALIVAFLFWYYRPTLEYVR